MNKLNKKIICEFIIIFMCMLATSIYIAGLIAPKIYFSNFLLSTVQVIFAVVVLMFMIPLYFHDLKIADEKYKTKSITKVNKRFWSYCIKVSIIVSIISIISYFTLGALVFLLNLRPYMLDVITIIIMIVLTISLVITFTIIIVRDVIKK